jgi:hypothetical protein
MNCTLYVRVHLQDRVIDGGVVVLQDVYHTDDMQYLRVHIQCIRPEFVAIVKSSPSPRASRYKTAERATGSSPSKVLKQSK